MRILSESGWLEVIRGTSNVTTLLFVSGGAALGYVYYRFVGCRSGVCPLTSHPLISTVYGAVLGFLVSGV